MRFVARFAAAFVLALLPSVAWAAPHGVRLTWAGDPATTVAVSWNSDAANDSMIQYGTSPSSLTSTATATAISQPSPLSNSFTANLTGLSPSTTYYYRVGGAGGAFYPGGTPFEFTTRSDDPCDPFRFVLIGDNRADTNGMSNPLWPQILDETMTHDPGFFVNTGDMVKNGDAPNEWVGFIDDSESGWAGVPSLLTMGNHDQDSVDGDSALYNQLYEHPRNSTTATEDYYSIDVGPIHFVSLNSQYNTPGSTEMNQMVAWLGADLAATTQPWKIVFFHKAVYTRGNHSSGEENNGAINAQLVPIFDTHDVDFVLNGHSHNYERYAPSLGVDGNFGGGGRSFPAGPGSSLGAAVPDGDVGTTYMVSGGAGALTTDILGFTCLDAACTYCTGFNINCDSEVYNNDVEGTVVYDGRHNFAIFDVAGDHIAVQVWTTAAGSSGPAEMIDSFSMTKTPFSIVCGGPPPPDAGVGMPDAAGPGTPDSGGGPGDPDGGVGPGSPDASTVTVGDSSGCSCRAAAAGEADPAAVALLGMIALGLLWRASQPRRKLKMAWSHKWRGAASSSGRRRA